MSLRVGVDLDGTLADLSSIYHEYEATLFGGASVDSAEVDDQEGAPQEKPTEKERLKSSKQRSARQDAVWRLLKSTPDFWTKLKPLETGAVAALQAAANRHGWEVYFVTQRPATAGDSVQKQTQRWLVSEGFENPSVLTLSGSRGKAAHALGLDFLIDDLPKNCVDAISDSRCRPILVLREPDEKARAVAHRMNIGVVSSVLEALALLEEPAAESRDTAVSRIIRALGLSR